MDLRDGSPQIDALIAKARAKNRDPAPQIREMRLHILAHAESKAKLRAIRSLGLRSSYAPAELQKPFVVAHLVFTGKTDDPELRRAFALKRADAMLGATAMLYGPPPAAPVAAPSMRLAAPTPPPALSASPIDIDDDLELELPVEPPPAKQEMPAAAAQGEPAK
jgi:hypothetical protein